MQFLLVGPVKFSLVRHKD